MVDKDAAAVIESDLISLPEEIEKKAEEKNQALEEYRKAELELEKEMARIIQTKKANVLAEVDRQLEIIIKTPKGEARQRMKALKMHMPTVEDLKAIATQETYEKALDVIKKESTWRSRMKEFDRARDDFESTKERSYNYRAEIKALRG